MTKILLIDDSKTILFATKVLLMNLDPGFEVLTAQSGMEGIKLAKSKQPDIILLDVVMPKMDGYEVCRRLRADKKTVHIPIIFLTGLKTSSKDKIKGLELGGDAYLTKPIEEGVLLAYLNAMIRIKKAEDERLHQYKDIVSSSTDMIALLDKEFTYLMVNQTYVDAFQKTLDEVIGYTVPEIFGKKFFETVLKPNADRCLAGEEVNCQAWVEFPAHGKCYMDASYSTYYNNDNKIMGFVVNARNITKRKQAEEEFEEIFNLSPDMLGVFTTDGKLVKINSSWEKVLGYKTEELLKMGWTRLVHPDDVETTNKEVEMQSKGSSIVNFINRYKCKDGSYKTLEWHASFAKDGVVHATAHDITERLQAEKALGQASKLDRKRVTELQKSVIRLQQSENTTKNLMEDLIHEFEERQKTESELMHSRNQLRQFARRLTAIREDERKKLAADIHDQLGQVVTALQINVSRLKKNIPKEETKNQTLINDIMELISNIDDSLNQMYKELRPFMLDELGLFPAIKWYLKEFENRTNIKCTLTLPKNLDITDSEWSTSFYRIYQEILTNVSRHAQATRVSVKLEKKLDKVIMTIKDNGTGIKTEEMDALDALGILGMKERVIQYNGDLKIVGKKDKGTNVRVELPFYKMDAES